MGRYAIFDEIAAGGMATVHLARLAGPVGFSRVVAVKRLHPQLLHDANFKTMFLDEARLAARVRHPNVVPTLDVLVNDDEVILVMEYVHGESLLALQRGARDHKTPIPLAVSVAIMISTLDGLHAAHEARDERGEPLGIVHRDISPHNVMVGADGLVRVLDFGVAKAIQSRADAGPGTANGLLKGKFSYMAPETLRGEPATRQADIFSAAIVFWELVTGRKLFGAPTEEERIRKILNGNYPPPSMALPNVPPIVDQIVMKGLSPDPQRRYATAHEMAVELENYLSAASQRVVGEWVGKLAADSLERRADLLQQIEVSNINSAPPPLPPLFHAPVAAAPTPPGASAFSGTLKAPARRTLAIAGGAAALISVVATLISLSGSPPPARSDVPPTRQGAIPTADLPVAVVPAPPSTVLEPGATSLESPPDPAASAGPASNGNGAADPLGDQTKAAPPGGQPGSPARSTRPSSTRPPSNAKDFFPTHL